ncbi:MAG: HD domain-containing protein [Coriobacteriia bacterium]
MVDDSGARKPASQDPDLLETPAGPIQDEARITTGAAFSARQIERVREVLARLSGARRAFRFYPEDHPAVDEAIERLMEVLSEYHTEGVDVPLTFYEDEVLLGEHMLAEESLLFDQLIRDITGLGATSVVFERGMSIEELRNAVRILTVDEQNLRASGGFAKLVESAALEHVKIAAVRVVDEGFKTEGETAARESYMTALDLLRDLEMALARGRSLPSMATRTAVRSLVENVLVNRFAMLELAGLKDYDEYTFYHSVNVAILSLAMGSSITSNRRFLNALGAGALMHDVGKMAVEGAILNKPGSLSPEEWAKMRLHPVHGAEMVATMPGLDKAAVVTILEHHMRYDGRGYPRIRMRRPQHLASRLVAVADSFDAMTSRRSYSAARLPDDAMAVIVESAGSAYDPRVVRLFVRMMGIYPARTVVLLESGEVAVVLRPNEGRPLEPVVRVVSGPDGEAVEPFDLDLSGVEGTGRAIKRALDQDALSVDIEYFM